MSSVDRSAVLDSLWSAYSSGASASDSVYATVREAIISGCFRAGEGLIEEHLARQFGVSRTPVREALLRLEAEDFAVRIPRRGLVVRAISEREMLDLYAVKIALDGLAARLAATEALPSEIAHLRWLNQQLGDVSRTGEAGRMRALSTEFHAALAKAAHNGLLVQFNDQILSVIRRFTSSVFAQPDRTGLMHEEHEQLIKALEAHDPDEAERLARQHASKVQQIRVEILHEDDDRTNGHATVDQAEPAVGGHPAAQ